MKTDSIIEGLREYIAGCPHLTEFTDHVDFADEDAGNYGIMPTGDDIIKRFMDRSAQRKYQFSLCARNFTVDDAQRVANSKFIEHFSDWIFQKNARREFPQIGEDKQPYQIDGANGVLFELAENADTGLYQIQCSLFYYQKVRKSI